MDREGRNSQVYIRWQTQMDLRGIGSLIICRCYLRVPFWCIMGSLIQSEMSLGNVKAQDGRCSCFVTHPLSES